MGGLAILRLKGGGNGAWLSLWHSQSAQSRPCLLYYSQLTQWSVAKRKMSSVPPSLAFPYNHRILQILNPAYNPTGPGPAGSSLPHPTSDTLTSLLSPSQDRMCPPQGFVLPAPCARNSQVITWPLLPHQPKLPSEVTPRRGLLWPPCSSSSPMLRPHGLAVPGGTWLTL